MYRFHQARHDALDSDYAIESPEVPVFRSEDAAGNLLDEPWLFSLITCPTVNVRAQRRAAPEREAEIVPAMRTRVEKVLTLAAADAHADVVLCAWSCRAFGIDGLQIATLFREHLEARFDEVVFAITDWSQERRFIGPFESVLDSREGID